MLLNTKSLEGELVLGIGTVNSGKSEDLAETYGKLRHSRYKYSHMIFSNSRNTRDSAGKIISGSGRVVENVFVANAENPGEVLDLIASKEVGRSKIKIGIFDEGNFHTYKFVPVVQQLMSQNRVVIVYGLDLDFRGEKFPVMQRLQEIARKRESVTGKRLVHVFESYCCVLDEDGEQCGDPAGYTLRAVKSDNEKQEEIRFIEFKDEEKIVVNGFTKASYFEPTIIVEGSNKNIKYTSACERHFGEVPGKRLTTAVLTHVQKETDAASYGAISKKFRDRNLPEVIAYAIEEHELNIHGGRYMANSTADHPTWEEAVGLVDLSKNLDHPDTKNVIEVYKLVKDAGDGIDRRVLVDRFRDVKNIERILSGLMKSNFITLEDARFTSVRYIRDIASGMPIPSELANQ